MFENIAEKKHFIYLMSVHGILILFSKWFDIVIFSFEHNLVPP